MKDIIVLLVENYLVHHRVIRDLLLTYDGVVGFLTAASFEEMKQQVADYGNRINLVITDWQLGQSTGGDVTAYVKAFNPEIFVIILSIHGYAKELAKKTGADAYADKNTLWEDLDRALDNLGLA